MYLRVYPSYGDHRKAFKVDTFFSILQVTVVATLIQRDSSASSPAEPFLVLNHKLIRQKHESGLSEVGQHLV